MRDFRSTSLGLVLLAVSFFWVRDAQAEDLQKIFDKVKLLMEQKNFPKALEELGWARKEIEKAHVTQLKSFLPDEVEDFKGGETKQEGALGISTLDRRYVKSGASFEVSLTGSSGSGGALAGMAQFGKMAGMMGMEQNAVRIEGFTAVLEEQKRPTLSIFLDSGSVFKLEGKQGVNGEDLKNLAPLFKLTELDKYLRGQQ